jgi:hypothetical protein
MLFFLPSVQALTADVIGETYSNSPDSTSSSAITYKFASVSRYTIEDDSGWLSPRIVEDLSLSQNDGPVINKAEPVPSQTQYYDGSNNLSSSTLRCRLNVSMSSCFAASNCGWCKSLGRCIPGNSESALYPCEAGMYEYSNN